MVLTKTNVSKSGALRFLLFSRCSSERINGVFFLSIIMFRRRIDQGNGYELRVWRAALRQRHHDRIPADDPAGHKSCSGE